MFNYCRKVSLQKNFTSAQSKKTLEKQIKKLLKKISFVNYTNAFFKAYLQERSAKKNLAFYQARAASKNIFISQGQKLQNALRSRLKGRSKGRWPKQKGTLHIFLAFYVSTWESILPLSLKPFGKVTAFNWRAQNYDDTARDWLDKRDQMNAAMFEVFNQASSHQPIDVVVGYLSGYNTAPKTLRYMANAGAVIYNFCWDDKLNFPGKFIGGRYSSPAALASVVDLNLTNAPESLIKYAFHGGLAMFWPEAAHPAIHCPYDVPFEFDVSFVGACYGWRPKFIARLKKFGINVECFGKGWPNGPLSLEEMTKLYSKSRINLGFAGVGHSKKLMCLKGRDFEVPMSGGLYLTQDNSELSLVYEIGKEIITYHDVQDCAEKIKFLLANPEEAEKIRNAGRKRALRDHTWEKRFEDVFSLAGLLRD